MTSKTVHDPTHSPWLILAAPIGKFGASLLIVSAFTAMFAPIVFLLNAESVLDPDLPASGLIALFSDPSRLLAISDFVAIVGVVLLAGAMAVVLMGLARGDKPASVVAFLLGGAVLVCLASWVPMMLYAQGQARGTITSVDAAAATGGYSIASIVLLAASLAYMAFTIRIENHAHPRKLTSLWWPAFAAVNVLGSVAIAGFFAGLESGIGSTEALSLGLVLKVTLIPMLGVMAYGDLKDRFPLWKYLQIMDPYKTRAVAAPTALQAPTAPQAFVPTTEPMTRKMVIPRRTLGGRRRHDEDQEPWVTVTPEPPSSDERSTVRPRPPV